MIIEGRVSGRVDRNKDEKAEDDDDYSHYSNSSPGHRPSSSQNNNNNRRRSSGSASSFDFIFASPQRGFQNTSDRDACDRDSVATAAAGDKVMGMINADSFYYKLAIISRPINNNRS